MFCCDSCFLQIWVAIFFILSWSFHLSAVGGSGDSRASTFGGNKVVVAGATGYIGRAVVKELIRRDIPTIALVRSRNIPVKTLEYLKGANICQCDVTNIEETMAKYRKIQPSATICCLASRSGIKREAWSVDYCASLNTVRAQESVGGRGKFVLLSAYCCGKPRLQFQYAKLKLEDYLKSSMRVSHSIVRPTAFFKSLDGQIERIRKGLPALYFGNGSCSANAISAQDLASFLADCSIDPERIGMHNKCRNIGGPDYPPVSKVSQIELIYDSLGIPKSKRKSLSLPISLLNLIINTFDAMEFVAGHLNLSEIRLKCEDAAEIARIVKYYATEPMVATGPGEIQGEVKLKDHFSAIAERGGELEEVDKMTTTTGVFELFTKNEYVK